ncbi:MAG: GNAT family N-acetyltransferase [Pseudomonadota bacterium]
MSLPEILRTPRLVLRPWAPSDLGALAGLLDDDRVMAFSATGPLGPKARAEWLSENCSATMSKAVTAEGRVFGYVRLNLAGLDHVLGIRLRPSAWGRGFAHEAAEAVLSAAKPNGRVLAEVDPENHRSIRLLKRLGFVEIGEVMHAGYDHPDLVFHRQSAS